MKVTKSDSKFDKMWINDVSMMYQNLTGCKNDV